MNWVYVSLVLLVWFVPVPIMVVIALRKWMQFPMDNFPRWRNTLGLISMLAILCTWLLIVVLTVIEITHESWMSIFSDSFYLVLFVFVTIATLAALSLKGKSRIFATAAGAINAVMAGLWLLRTGMP